MCGKIPESNLKVNTDRIVAHQIQSLSIYPNRVPTHFICFNHFNGSELTAIKFVNIPYSIQKGRYLLLNHYRMQVVLSLLKNNSFQLVLFPTTLYFYLPIHYSWCSELITGHCDKTKILNSTNMIFKGRNLSLVNLFCWH